MAKQICCCGSNLYGAKLISVACFCHRALSLLMLSLSLARRDNGINYMTVVFFCGLIFGLVFDVVLFVGTFVRNHRCLLSWFIFRWVAKIAPSSDLVKVSLGIFGWPTFKISFDRIVSATESVWPTFNLHMSILESYFRKIFCPPF